MNRGYVKLWRKTLDNGIMQNPRLMLFWIWCLLKASHKVHETMVGYQKVTLQKGQFVFGLKASSKETKLGVQTIRTCLEALKSTHQVTYQPTHSFSIVTICNWELYQSQDSQGNTPSNTQSNTPVTDLQHAGNTPVTTNKNGNNGEKGENGSHTQSEDAHKPVSKEDLKDIAKATAFIKMHPAFSKVPDMAIHNTLNSFSAHRDHWPKILRQYQTDNAGVDTLKYKPCQDLRIAFDRYIKFNSISNPHVQA